MLSEGEVPKRKLDSQQSDLPLWSLVSDGATAIRPRRTLAITRRTSQELTNPGGGRIKRICDPIATPNIKLTIIDGGGLLKQQEMNYPIWTDISEN